VQNEEQQPSSPLPVFGFRHVFAMLAFLGFVFVYALRVCLSVAVVLMRDQYGWDDATSGKVLASFFVGYVVLQVPGGRWAEKCGGKRVYGLALVATCLFTLLTPWAADRGLAALICIIIIL